MREINYIKTAERLDEMIHARKLTRARFAAKLGVCPQAVYAWLDGNKTPTLRHLVAMTEIFDCTLDDLVIYN